MNEYIQYQKVDLTHPATLPRPAQSMVDYCCMDASERRVSNAIDEILNSENQGPHYYKPVAKIKTSPADCDNFNIRFTKPLAHQHNEYDDEAMTCCNINT